MHAGSGSPPVRNPPVLSIFYFDEWHVTKRQLNLSIFLILLSFFGCPLLSTTLLPSLGICKRNPRCKLWFKNRFQSKSNCGSSVWMGLQLEIIGAKMLIGTVYRWRLGIVLLLCSNIPSFLWSILCLYDSNKLILVLLSDFYIVICNND